MTSFFLSGGFFEEKNDLVWWFLLDQSLLFRSFVWVGLGWLTLPFPRFSRFALPTTFRLVFFQHCLPFVQKLLGGYFWWVRLGVGMVFSVVCFLLSRAGSRLTSAIRLS